jgi:2,3-bisphosphoglycerate-independent phosphoglycerate mutase
VNYANGDMVGHTRHRDATIKAVECIDLQLARLMKEVERLGGILVVTADHGNADEMYEHGKGGAVVRDEKSGAPVPKTSHTLNPVPFMIWDPRRTDAEYALDLEVVKAGGLANVTATLLALLGFERPEDEEPALVRWP